MKIVIFGLTISSSWGNGHATIWRSLAGALIARGHRIVFFERDVPYYAAHRDLPELPGGELVLFPDWESVRETAQRHLNDADVAIVTSYCADAVAAAELAHWSGALRVFYDLDTPVTLARLQAGEEVNFLGERALRDFDLVLSFTGGAALEELQTRLGATRVAPLYGSVDAEKYGPRSPRDLYRSDLSYLGTFAADRQPALQRLFLESARRRPSAKFLIGGAQYPAEFPWSPNIHFVQHVPPGEHPAFYSSSRLTLNVTRAAMAAMGWCPSGRLFEGAACAVPIVSDWWDGLDDFFAPNEEILIARETEDVLAALELSDEELKQIGRNARERVLAAHTGIHRAADFEAAVNEAMAFC